MFAVINHLYINIPFDELKMSVEQEGLPILSELPGFRDFYWIRAAEDHAVVVIIWETAADADNGSKVFGPTWFAKSIAPHLAREQERYVGEVAVKYEP